MSGHLRFWAVCNRHVTLCAMGRNNYMNFMYDVSSVLKWLDRIWAYGKEVMLMCLTVFYWLECSTEVPGGVIVPECPS
jgi:hypothetical protein